jgi:thioredoxin 2
MNASTEPQVYELQGLQAVCGHCFTPNRVPFSRLGEDPRCGKCAQHLLDGEPVTLDERRFDQFVAKNELPVLVDFWAAWCAPCRVMAPTFESVARELGSTMRFAKIDVDASPAVARRFGVSSIPTLILFQRGAEVRRIAGALSATQLKGWIAGAS